MFAPMNQSPGETKQRKDFQSTNQSIHSQKASKENVAKLKNIKKDGMCRRIKLCILNILFFINAVFILRNVLFLFSFSEMQKSKWKFLTIFEKIVLGRAPTYFNIVVETVLNVLMIAGVCALRCSSCMSCSLK